MNLGHSTVGQANPQFAPANMNRSDRTGGHGTLRDRDMDLPEGNTITDDVVRDAACLDCGLQGCLDNTSTPVDDDVYILDAGFLAGMHRTQRDGAPGDGVDFLRGVHHRPAGEKAPVDRRAHGGGDQLADGVRR